MTEHKIYGLFSIAIMYFNIANQLEEKNCSQPQYNEEIEYYYLLSAKLNYSPAMVNIAIYYEMMLEELSYYFMFTLFRVN